MLHWEPKRELKKKLQIVALMDRHSMRENMLGEIHKTLIVSILGRQIDY
jgi:hypothetical protein